MFQSSGSNKEKKKGKDVKGGKGKGKAPPPARGNRNQSKDPRVPPIQEEGNAPSEMEKKLDDDNEDDAVLVSTVYNVYFLTFNLLGANKYTLYTLSI